MKEQLVRQSMVSKDMLKYKMMQKIGNRYSHPPRTGKTFTHVAQQKQGRVEATTQMKTGTPAMIRDWSTKLM